MRKWTLFLTAVASILMACSGGTQMTLQEYAAEICGFGLGDEGLTNDEVADLISDELDRMRSINPPEVMEPYHDISLQILVSAKAILDELEGEYPFTPFSLLALVSFNEETERIYRAMPDRARHALFAAGCDIGEE